MGVDASPLSGRGELFTGGAVAFRWKREYREERLDPRFREDDEDAGRRGIEPPHRLRFLRPPAANSGRQIVCHLIPGRTSERNEHPYIFRQARGMEKILPIPSEAGQRVSISFSIARPVMDPGLRRDG